MRESPYALVLSLYETSNGETLYDLIKKIHFENSGGGKFSCIIVTGLSSKRSPARLYL